MKKIFVLLVLAFLIGLNTNVVLASDCEVSEITASADLDNTPYVKKTDANIWAYINSRCPVTVHYRPGWIIFLQEPNRDLEESEGKYMNVTRIAFIKLYRFDWANADSSIMNTGLFQRVSENEWKYDSSLELALEYQPGFDVYANGVLLKPGKDASATRFRIVRRSNKD